MENNNQKLYREIMCVVSQSVKKMLQESTDFDFNDNSVLNEDLVISQTMREKRPGLNDELVIELKNRLSKGEVKFSFRKLNDKLRRARGTVDLNTILKENPDFGEWDKEYQPLKLKNPYVIRYYDLDKKNWRSCDVSRLLIIIE